jgi:integral membrane sensor domain MASE1
MIRPSLQRSLIAFALIFAAGFVGYSMPSMGGRLPLMLLPSGLAVAAMCRWGLGQWPAVFLAGTAIDLSSHSPPFVALDVGVGLAAGAALSCASDIC